MESFRGMAQLVARMHGVHEAVGSSPATPTKFYEQINYLDRHLYRFNSRWVGAAAVARLSFFIFRNYFFHDWWAGRDRGRISNK